MRHGPCHGLPPVHHRCTHMYTTYYATNCYRVAVNALFLLRSQLVCACLMCFGIDHATVAPWTALWGTAPRSTQSGSNAQIVHITEFNLW